MPACLFSICTRLGPTPRALKYQDLRQKHQSAISEARMRSRLGIAISIVKLDLIEGGPAGKQDQPLHDQIPLYFIAAPSTPARRPSAERLFSRERLIRTGRRTSTGC